MKNNILLNSDIVGKKINSVKFRVDYRQTSNFAASISDENKVYFYSESEKNPVAHPLFPVTITWQIVKNIIELCEYDLNEKIFEKMLHRSEHLEMQRLIRPGDELTVSGEFSAILPHSAGTKLNILFFFRDNKDQLIIKENVGVFLPGIFCTDEGRQIYHLPEDEIVETDKALWETQIPVSAAAPYVYDGCTEISYPVHTDWRFARAMGLPGIILQGTATLSMCLSKIIQSQLNNNPAKIKSVSAKFTNILLPPNLITVRLRQKKEHQLLFDATDKKGTAVIRGGSVQYD